MTVRLTLVLTGIIGLCLFKLSYAAGMGLIIGGLTATVAFWFMARGVEKLATMPKGAVQFAAYRWTFMRLGLYGLALYKAYTLDPVTFHGLIAAVGGLMLLRVVLIVVAATGLDLKQHEK